MTTAMLGSRLADVSHFLIVYQRSTGTLLEFKEFPEPDRAKALSEGFAREMHERNNPDIEVIILGADSREALMRTHGRYFKTIGQSMKELADKLEASLRKE